MGGNAIDQTYDSKPGRKPADEYFRIMERTCWKLNNMFPWSLTSAVRAYHTKSSFGDGDILLDRDELPPNWIRLVHSMFSPQNMVINRFKGTPLSYKWNDEVPPASPECFSVSFDVQGLQVDLILVDREEFHTARVYYAFNDLGNFMGRIAERMGFTYGWNGFWKEVRYQGEVVDKLLVSRDSRKVFEFLGYDYDRFKQGFDTLEDVYQFAASTKYFNRHPFLLENRNHKSRVRDAKRASYNGFLEWMKDKPELDKYGWLQYDPAKPAEHELSMRSAERNNFLHKAVDAFPGLRDKHDACIAAEELKRKVKKVWNGDVVWKITNYTGEKLGKFMKYCRESFPITDSRYPTFDHWIVTIDNWDVMVYVEDRMGYFKFED